MTKPRIVIAGGGLAGAYLASLIAQAGRHVTVVEKRPDPRQTQQEGNRSINLAISKRGLTALYRISAAAAWDDLLIPMYGRQIHLDDGAETFQPYAPDPSLFIGSISRSQLNIRLLDLAEATGRVEVLFEANITAVDFDRKQLRLDGKTETRQLSFDHLIGADGTASPVRSAILEQTKGDYRADFLNYGYKELFMPPAANGKHQISANALHIWPRSDFMLIGLPNPGGSYTCTLFLPEEGNKSFASLDSLESIEQFVASSFPDIPALIPDYAAQLLANPVGRLGTVRVEPWYYKDHAVIIGDAAHGIVPFYGQGMNAALESASLLFDELVGCDFADWQAAFQAFAESRAGDVAAIAELAERNFHEMQDHIADQEFLRRKALLQSLEARYSAFATEYSLVTFSNRPYRFAKKQGELQQQLLRDILREKPDLTDIDDPYVKQKVNDYLIQNQLL